MIIRSGRMESINIIHQTFSNIVVFTHSTKLVHPELDGEQLVQHVLADPSKSKLWLFLETDVRAAVTLLGKLEDSTKRLQGCDSEDSEGEGK